MTVSFPGYVSQRTWDIFRTRISLRKSESTTADQNTRRSIAFRCSSEAIVFVALFENLQRSKLLCYLPSSLSIADSLKNNKKILQVYTVTPLPQYSEKNRQTGRRRGRETEREPERGGERLVIIIIKQL